MPEERTVSQTCPPDMAFVELVEGRLIKAEAEGLRRHAERCEKCQAALQGLGGAAPMGLDSTLPVAQGTADGIARGLLGEEEAEEGDAGGSIGKTIDRKYRLLRQLGAGGMGSVHEAEHTG